MIEQYTFPAQLLCACIQQVQGDNTFKEDSVSSGRGGCLEKELQGKDRTLPWHWASARTRQWDERTWPLKLAWRLNELLHMVYECNCFDCGSPSYETNKRFSLSIKKLHQQPKASWDSMHVFPPWAPPLCDIAPPLHLSREEQPSSPTARAGHHRQIPAGHHHATQSRQYTKRHYMQKFSMTKILR